MLNYGILDHPGILNHIVPEIFNLRLLAVLDPALEAMVTILFLLGRSTALDWRVDQPMHLCIGIEIKRMDIHVESCGGCF